MARALRFQYPGAVYHVMARGDGGRTVFENKDDCEVFLNRMGDDTFKDKLLNLMENLKSGNQIT